MSADSPHRTEISMGTARWLLQFLLRSDCPNKLIFLRATLVKEEEEDEAGSGEQ